MEKNKVTFNNYRDALAKMYIMGYRNYVIHKQIMSYYDKNPNYVKKSPIFFQSISYASDYTAIQHLINMFERRERKQSDLITLHSYLDFIKSNLGIFNKGKIAHIKKLLIFDEERLKNKTNLVKKLLTLRDNLLSHLDKKAAKNFNQFLKDINLKRPIELDELYSLAKEIINRYSFYFNETKIKCESESEIIADFWKLIIGFDLSK